MLSSISKNAISGSIIQNSDKCRGVLEFSALKVLYSSPNLGSVPMRLPPANKTVEKIGVKLIELPDAVKNMPKEMVRHLKINKDGKYLYDTNLIMQSELLNMAAGSIRKNHRSRWSALSR